MKWIRIKDRLPKDYTSCLIVNKSYVNNITSGYYVRGIFFDSTGCDTEETGIESTHWMDISELPEIPE